MKGMRRKGVPGGLHRARRGRDGRQSPYEVATDREPARGGRCRAAAPRPREAGSAKRNGDAFSLETFLTNLASMSPAARRALFSSSGFDGLEARVNQLGAMAANRREGAKVFANPRGTARQTALIGWMGSLMTALATGNPVALGAALGAPVAAGGVARTLTSDRFVKEIAKPTVLSAGLGPSAVAAAARAPESFTERRETNRARLREQSAAAR